jgi:hypothetical protein
MTLNELIEKYKQQTIICFNVDYGSGKSVRANNKAVDNMFKIVANINKDYGVDGIKEFAKLLTQSDYKTNLWVATQLLERTKPSETVVNQALSVIKDYANSEHPDAFVYKDWLKNWNDNNPDEQTLKSKRLSFKIIAVGYSIILLLVSILFYLFPNKLGYGKMNFLFFYLLTVFLLNSLFYLSLQRKIKRMTSSLFGSLSSICLMGGLGVGIFILLLFGLSTIQPKMILVFSPLYFILTIWTGRKYWLGKNWYDR